MPRYGPLIHKMPPIHVSGPLGFPLGTWLETLSDPGGACRVPWEGKEHWLWGFEGRIGVDNTGEELLFHLHPWTVMEDWEVEEGKEDGFYLVTPSLVRGSGGAQDDPQLFQSGIFFFFFKITVFIMTMVTPRCTGGRILCFSNLFVNKCTMLHMWWALLLC